VAEANPTVRQRELGVRLRQLRGDLDLTVDQVAEGLLCSATKISRIETGKRRASLRDVRDLCQLYKVGEQETAQLMNLARQAREAGWWAQYDDLEMGPYLGLEQEATALTFFSLHFVSGLLQTEDYARHIIKGVTPQIDPKVLEERVEARMRRQLLLDQPVRPRVRILMDEAVLHRQVGGPGVMHGQLTKILQFSTEAKMVIQVIPFSTGAHASVDSNFTLFEFGDSPLSDLIHIESLTSSLYVERQPAKDRYRESLDNLRDASLSIRDSMTLITTLRNALQSPP
jgi:transcriptional regulator with XRE-family HTH domain